MRMVMFSLFIMFLFVAAEMAEADVHISPVLIQTYNVVSAQNRINSKVNPIADQAALFQGKNATQASQLVADRYAQFWWNHSEAKNSSVGRQVVFVENGMKQQMVYKKNGVNHKFDFSVQAFSALAKLEYTGYFKAAVSYQATDASSLVEVSEKIGKQKDLVLSSTANSIEQRNAVNLKWSW